MSKKVLNRLILAVSAVIIISLPIFTYISLQKPKQILSAKTQTSPTFMPTPSASASASLHTANESAFPTLSKSNYTIALFGDSFIDTMGENLNYLQASLNTKYPLTKFKFYNYGIGSQNIEVGLARFNSPLTYKQRSFPAIGNIGADVIILGSFAYNPFSPHDRNKHYLDLIELENKAKSTGASIYQLAEIAPLKNGFGKGPNGINWPAVDANSQATKIVEQLEDAVNAAKTTNIPLINAFYPSQTDGQYGNSSFVNADDGIHPSIEGHRFIADLIAKNLNLK